MPFWPPLLPADKPKSFKHRGRYKYIDFYISLLNLTKPFNSGLGKWMCKAARHSDGVDSLNSCRWRGEQLHHHGGGVYWLFVLLWVDSWRHELTICIKWYKDNPKESLCGVTFCPTLACTTPVVADANEADEADGANDANEANEVLHSPSRNIFQSLQKWRNILALLKMFGGACTPSEFKVRRNVTTNQHGFDI